MFSSRRITLEEYTKSSNEYTDKFIGRFTSKVRGSGSKYGDHIIGAFDNEGRLLGAIVYSLPSNRPHIANLQLLHVFSEFRGSGVGEYLCSVGFKDVIDRGAKYLRISMGVSAMKFYQKMGIKIQGIQKCRAVASAFRIEGDTFSDGYYGLDDPIVNRIITTQTMGGCVEVFKDGVVPDWVTENHMDNRQLGGRKDDT